MRLRPDVLGAAAGAFLSLALAPRSAFAVDGEWPKEIEVPEGRIVMYQPQPESFENDALTGRAAVSVTPKGRTEPVFGVIWFASVVDIDKDTRLCHIHTTKITDVRVSDAKPEQQQRLAEILTNKMKDRSIDLAYDRLLASLETSDSERVHAENLSTAPPVILVEDQPAILVVVQGEPALRDLGKTGLKKVVNTPFFLVQDPTTNKFWLNGGTWWFSAQSVEGPYSQSATPPSSVTEAYQQQLQAEGTKEAPVAEEGKDEDRVPKIIVATKPTELIFIDGKPNLTPLSGSELLYVENSEDDLFVESATKDHYVVLSGRWYKAKSWNGPWDYVRSDSLPATFASIPETSEKGHVLAFVAGTVQAEDAVMDAQIPETAAIKRDAAQCSVTYDGDPDFKAIPNTQIAYAVNSPDAVFEIGEVYYCCKEGVWFTSSAPNGPWSVADRVPVEIQDIPPDNPHYNVKFVEVYDSTPEIVYVGYTPAYYGCYPYYGSIVWGTGYTYPPYIGPLYCYPYHATWGFHANYNPWTGWSNGMSWSAGWAHFSVGFGGGYSGCWGPAGYAWRGNTNHINHHVNVNRPVNINTGNVGRGPGNSLYDRGQNKAAVVDRGQFENARSKDRAATHPTNMPNDVVAGRDGNVYRRDSNGNIQQHDGRTWQSTDMSTRVDPTSGTRPTPPHSSTRPETNPSASTREFATEGPHVSPESSQSLQRQYEARDRGAVQTQNYQIRSASGASRPSGAVDVGGRR